MLADLSPHTTLPVQDLDRARAFYADKLGLTPTTEAPGGLFYEFPNGRFVLFPTSGQPSGSHTQMGWAVDDIDAEVAALRERGVEFEHYDGLTGEDGIAQTGPNRAAWFKDSEGNLIGVVQLG